MRYEMIAPPVEEPVMPEEVKLQLQLTQAEYEEQRLLIELLITAAREEAEALLNRALVKQRWRLLTDRLAQITLPRQAVIDVVSIQYDDPDGTRQTLPAYQYTLVGWERRELVPAPGATWPFTSAAPENVEIVWDAGYGPDYRDVPAQIRRWMLARIRTLYDHRDQITTGTVVASTPHLDDYITSLRVTGV